MLDKSAYGDGSFALQLSPFSLIRGNPETRHSVFVVATRPRMAEIGTKPSDVPGANGSSRRKRSLAVEALVECNALVW